MIKKYVEKFDTLRLRRAVYQLKEEYDDLRARNVQGHREAAHAALDGAGSSPATSPYPNIKCDHGPAWPLPLVSHILARHAVLARPVLSLIHLLTAGRYFTFTAGLHQLFIMHLLTLSCQCDDYGPSK